jgi:hypothetical protein
MLILHLALFPLGFSTKNVCISFLSHLYTCHKNAINHTNYSPLNQAFHKAHHFSLLEVTMRCHLLCWLSSVYTVTLYLTCLYWSPVPQPLFLSAAISWHSLHPPATQQNASHDWLHTLCSISEPQGRPPFKEGCTTCLQKWQHEMPKTYKSAILKLTVFKQNIPFYKHFACDISCTSLFQVQAYFRKFWFCRQ